MKYTIICIFIFAFCTFLKANLYSLFVRVNLPSDYKNDIVCITEKPIIKTHFSNIKAVKNYAVKNKRSGLYFYDSLKSKCYMTIVTPEIIFINPPTFTYRFVASTEIDLTLNRTKVMNITLNLPEININTNIITNQFMQIINSNMMYSIITQMSVIPSSIVVTTGVNQLKDINFNIINYSEEQAIIRIIEDQSYIEVFSDTETELPSFYKIYETNEFILKIDSTSFISNTVQYANIKIKTGNDELKIPITIYVATDINATNELQHIYPVNLVEPENYIEITTLKNKWFSWDHGTNNYNNSYMILIKAIHEMQWDLLRHNKIYGKMTPMYDLMNDSFILDGDTIYEWRVATIYTNSAVAYSDIRQFKTPPDKLNVWLSSTNLTLSSNSIIMAMQEGEGKVNYKIEDLPDYLEFIDDYDIQFGHFPKQLRFNKIQEQNISETNIFNIRFWNDTETTNITINVN